MRYRQEGALAVRSLLIKDQKDTAKVCLFGPNAETNYASGDCVKVSAVYPKTYYQKLQLTTSPASTGEVQFKSIILVKIIKLWIYTENVIIKNLKHRLKTYMYNILIFKQFGLQLPVNC